MKRVLPVILICVSAAAAEFSPSNELSSAKEALRDGLWEVARTHAALAGGEEGLAVELESYARESKWKEILARLGPVAEAESKERAYYRALAFYKMGRVKDSEEVLQTISTDDPEYKILVKRLGAILASVQGDGARAVKLLREADCEKGDAEAKCAVAEVYVKAGDKESARRIWRDVASMKDVGERELATAASNLGDVALLRRACEVISDVRLRRAVGLRLGTALMGEASSFDEGERIVRRIVRDAPDTRGARDAMILLADALRERKEWGKASDAYSDVLAIWPESALLPSVQEGRGWAFRRLGKVEEALEAFSRAEELSTDVEAKASVMTASADVLSDAGRYDEAMLKYRAVKEKYPKTPAGMKVSEMVRRYDLERQARELYKDYRFSEAQKVFDALAAEDPERRFKSELFGALCLYGQGRDEEAADKARSLAEGCTNAAIRAEATLWLAKLLYNRRQWRESCRLFSSYSDQMPNSPQAPEALVWSARAAFAENDFQQAVRIVSSLSERYPDSAERACGYLVQGEALVELSRFDEAVLVLERALVDERTPPEERMRAELLKADALFAMGADNPARYEEALAAYRKLRQGRSLSRGMMLAVSFKIGRTLEKLHKLDEAIDQYYTEVVIAYREGRQRGVSFDDEARAAFARAAFRLADEFESRGKDSQAMHILELVVASDVPASDEAERRIERIQTKGKFL
ncbi:MAG: tetratricopeptide repeat protein [Lentisphaerae bacterium]|nr:tetratricopeptide repeat protein [Lentisphaerota bacterium]